jgi:hypothetical protein
MSSRQTSRAALAALTLAVFGLLIVGLVAPAQAATSTGKVKGVVSLSGKPVKNAKVQLYTHLRSDFDDTAFAYDRIKTVSTDSKGRYSFNGIKTGTWKNGPKYFYAVLVTDRTGKGAKTLRYFDVRKGRTTIRDVGLKPAVILTGSVTRSDGGPAGELTVDMSSNETRNDTDPLNQEFYPDSSTAVRPDGTFTVKGQAAGEFQVIVRGDAYLYQCYDFDTNTLEECMNRPGTDIVLKAGERRVLSPVTATKLAPPVTTVTGRVTDPSGHPLKGIEVTLGGTTAGTPVVSRANGRFTYQGRPPAGEYAVRYRDPKKIWGLTSMSDAAVSRVTVTPGQPVTDVDTTLKSLTSSKHSTKGGKGTAKLAFDITRKATEGRPGGTLTVSYKDRTKTVVVVKGKATATLTGLRAGTRAIVVTYSGTATTAGFTKRLNVKVK